MIASVEDKYFFIIYPIFPFPFIWIWIFPFTTFIVIFSLSLTNTAIGGHLAFQSLFFK